MKIKEGFELRKMLRENIVVAKGLQNIDFNKIISLNESAAYLWKAVQGTDFDEEKLVALLQEEYEVDDVTAKADVAELVKAWVEAGLVE